MCQAAGLGAGDLGIMNIGNALDHVYAWLETRDPKRKTERWATQADIDALPF